ncbi:uncharacterized protein EDB91DRAFT_16588 [Suillus paluster]|uniref:uncharacterized protein n=1 Tax=Suillus paluster TaxID=48578 RepID=UPI001B882F50|nr:uncharacterized protein EDB91DRAFT_16588 [Suillus paluster]KAG1756457.1 hypothetical protein EDB91DRAFT_16588 [Suillus paluster]
MTDSPRSNSSIDIISSISCAATETSEDEVVWGASDEYSSDSSGSDYVLLPHTSVDRSPESDHDSDDSVSETRLSIAFDLLSVTTSSKLDGESDTNKNDKADEKLTRKQLRTARRKARRSKGGKSEDTHPSSTSLSPQSGSGANPTYSYEDAAAFITQYLESPVKDGNPSTKLRLLQALVVEFGISQQLPTSIKSAKKLLNAEVHVNIKEYVARRGKDQGALRQIMHPSKSALRKDIRRSGQKKSLKWVKKYGLNVLLIDCYN